MNDTPDIATLYRGLLIAKVTAVHTPASGPLNGRKVYEWTEQLFNPATGAETDALSPRKGVYTSATEFHNCLLDPNDTDIPVPSFVWARMKGVVTGITVYETIASTGTSPPPPPPPPPPSGVCYDCGFLLDKNALKTRAFKLTVPEALGRCSCVPSSQGDDETFLLCYEPAEDAWIGTRQFQTCCGCGVVKLQLNPAATLILGIPTFTLTVNKGCASDAAYTATLLLGCCERLPSGNPAATFVGWGEENCGADDTLPDPAECENLFRVTLECTDERCLAAVRCDCKLCVRCCENGNGVSHWKVDGSGFAGGDCSAYDYVHHLVTGGGCTWAEQGGCAGGTIGGVVLQYIEDPNPDLSVVRLTFTGGGPTEKYEIQANSWSCCTSNTLARKAPQQCSVSPASVTVVPVFCGADETCCAEENCGACEPTVYAWHSIPGVASPVAMSGTTMISGCKRTGGFTTSCGPGTVMNGWQVSLLCNNKTSWTFEVDNGDVGAYQSVIKGPAIVWQRSPLIASFCYTPGAGDCGAGGGPYQVLIGTSNVTPPAIPGGADPCGPDPNCTLPGTTLLLAHMGMRASSPPGGPGTELKALLSSLGLNPVGGCGCQSLATEMDRMGVEGCQRERERIINELRIAKAETTWKQRLVAGARAVLSGLAFRLDPRDPAPGLLDEAIRRAEANLPPPTPPPPAPASPVPPE